MQDEAPEGVMEASDNGQPIEDSAEEYRTFQADHNSNYDDWDEEATDDQSQRLSGDEGSFDVSQPNFGDMIPSSPEGISLGESGAAVTAIKSDMLENREAMLLAKAKRFKEESQLVSEGKDPLAEPAAVKKVTIFCNPPLNI